MRYRNLLPHNHLTLDAPFAAVLLTVLGLTSSFFIQALVDFVFILGRKPALNWLGLGMLLVTLARAGFCAPRSYLLAHLSQRIDAETVIGYHRHLLGLPLTFLSVARCNDHHIESTIERNTLRCRHADCGRQRIGLYLLELQPADARAKLSSLYRELQQIQLNLSRFTITSPADGQIMSLAALYPGKMILAGTAIAVAVPRKTVSDDGGSGTKTKWRENEKRWRSSPPALFVSS